MKNNCRESGRPGELLPQLVDAAQLPSNDASSSLTDQVGDLTEQSRHILWFNEHRAPGIGPAVVITGEERGRRLIIHEPGMRQNFEPRFWRFHLQVAQN